MQGTIKRESINLPGLEKESHHQHEIVLGDDNVLYWKANPDVVKLFERIDVNDAVEMLEILGYGKNSEIYRKLYRDIGCSLVGYWEIFYWEVNNPQAQEYSVSQQ